VRRLVAVGSTDDRHFVRIDAMRDKEAELEWFDRAGRRGLIIDRQRDHLDFRCGEPFAGTQKVCELSLTIGAPGPWDWRMVIAPPPAAETSRTRKTWPFRKRVIANSADWTAWSILCAGHLDCQVHLV
jgi:hypothetical protein